MRKEFKLLYNILLFVLSISNSVWIIKYLNYNNSEPNSYSLIFAVFSWVFTIYFFIYLIKVALSYIKK